MQDRCLGKEILFSLEKKKKHVKQMSVIRHKEKICKEVDYDIFIKLKNCKQTG